MHDDGYAYVVRLAPALARRVNNHLEHDAATYPSLSDFVAVALENQLALDAGAIDELRRSDHSGGPGAALKEDRRGESPAAHDRAGSAGLGLFKVVPADEIAEWLCRPAPGALSQFVNPSPNGVPLFALTNRLSPIALSIRVLANLTVAKEAPPSREEYVRTAAHAARHVALVLRTKDEEDLVPLSDRRSTGWPAGQDAEKSLDRFIWAYLVHRAKERDPGAMEELGLAVVNDDRVVLTHAGFALAVAPSPLMSETDGWTLGSEQQQILRACVLANDGERAEIETVLGLLVRDGSSQGRIDAAVQGRHPTWSQNQVVSQRAAVLSRLRELDVVELAGRGPKAKVRISSAGQDFASQLLNETTDPGDGRENQPKAV
jgi:hypothetical protein